MRTLIRSFIANESNERYFGPGPASLLREVEKTGSLRKAAASMGMAYSKASRIIHHSESELGFCLIDGHTGGKAGGGSRLTEEGRAFLACYEAFREETERAAEEIFRRQFKAFLPIRIVIMASGHSRRYGINKLLEKVDGETMIHHAMSIIPPEMRKEAVVITRYPVIAQEAETMGIPCRIHDRPDQSDTIEIGLEGAENTGGCMFMPADMPWLTQESIRNLVQAFKQHPDDISRLGWNGKPGAPVIFPPSTYEALRALRGDTGGREVIRSSGLAVHITEAQSEKELSDIDRPEDI